MFDPSALHGIIPPICTPLTPEGDLDRASAQRLVEFQLAAGVHGLFALGSTGELAALTDDQRRELLETVVAATAGRAPILAGIFDTSTRRCISNAQMARAAGADALVLAPTYYFRAGQRELLDLFRAVHAAVDLPILAYDVPGAVNVKLDAATVATLAEEGVICGIKDSSGVFEGFREVLMRTRHLPFRAFTGSELLVDACLHLGAHGSVPGLANVFPAAYVRLYDLARADDWAGAAAVQERLLACFRELITQGDPAYSASASALGGFKTGLKLQGVITHTAVAAPLHSFTPAEEERVVDVIRRHGLL
jgi:4-hydroxy-tetrahydrodipicolinate synthase